MKFDDERRMLLEKTLKIPGFRELVDGLDKTSDRVDAIVGEKEDGFVLPYSSPQSLPKRQWKVTKYA